MFVGLGGKAGAVFQQDVAGHAHLGGNGHGLAGMVGLGRALGDDGVSAQCGGFAHEKFKLAGFVAAGTQAGAVVAFDVQVGAAQGLGQTGHEFQGRWAVGNAHAGEGGQFHGVLAG